MQISIKSARIIKYWIRVLFQIFIMLMNLEVSELFKVHYISHVEKYFKTADIIFSFCEDSIFSVIQKIEISHFVTNSQCKNSFKVK